MRYADPEAQKEIDRLNGELHRLRAVLLAEWEKDRETYNRLMALRTRVEWLATGWVEYGIGPRSTASGQLRACGQILLNEVTASNAPKETA